jgi:phosphonate transport system permease protein
MSAFPTLQRDAPLPHRDPAALRRWATLLVAAVLLWPLLVWTEFQPWTLWDARSLKVAGRFIASFIPPPWP